jgi:hypothetical protein
MEWELVAVGDGNSKGEHAALTSFVRFAQLDPALAGRARLVEQPPANGAMGALTIAATVIGAARSVASVVTAWLKASSSDVTIQVNTGNGRSVKVSAKNIRKVGAAELQMLVDEFTAALEGSHAGGLKYVQVIEEGKQPAEG